MNPTNGVGADTKPFIPATTVRYLHFLTNLVLLESAIALAVVALLSEIDFLIQIPFLSYHDARLLPLIILVFCGIIFLVTLIGCCSLIQDNRCCLILFSVFLSVVALVEIVVGIYAFTARDAIATNLQKELNQTLPKYNREANVKRWWNNLQHEFECCGVTKASDWNLYLKKLPSSCCNNLPVGNKCTSAKVSKPGCYATFAKSVQFKSLSIAGIAIAIGFVQFFCAFLSGSFALSHQYMQYEVELDKIANSLEL